MTALAELDSDVFVSYSHIDDQPLSEGQTGWVSALHRALEVRLAQLLGKPPRIWRDPKLQGNDYFADRLTGTLPKCAVLVSILSPRYVRSDWCRRELAEFCRSSQGRGGVRIADKSRVFKVVKTPVPQEQHPAELQELLGYDFFVIEPATGRPRELSPGADSERQRHYWARLDDLAHDISELLQLLEAEVAPEAAPEAAGAVYLAETTSDLNDRRDAIRRELQGSGYTVLPDRPLPLVGTECAALVREQLERCRLSVHLVGHSYGLVPEGMMESIVALQSELATRRGEAGGFSRLIWIPPGLEVRDERQQQLIRHLRTDPCLQRGADLLETSLEDLKAALHQRLLPPDPGAGGAAPGSAGPARVYLICDQRDLEETASLADHLFARGLEVILPVFEGEEAQVRRDHEENLALCDAALVYYGAGTELWLRQKLREIQKSAAYGRSGPIQARAVLVAPPDTPQKRLFRTHEAFVIAPPNGLAPALLEPFLAQVQAQAGGQP